MFVYTGSPFHTFIEIQTGRCSFLLDLNVNRIHLEPILQSFVTSPGRWDVSGAGVSFLLHSSFWFSCTSVIICSFNIRLICPLGSCLLGSSFSVWVECVKRDVFKETVYTSFLCHLGC